MGNNYEQRAGITHYIYSVNKIDRTYKFEKKKKGKKEINGRIKEQEKKNYSNGGARGARRMSRRKRHII